MSIDDTTRCDRCIVPVFHSHYFLFEFESETSPGIFTSFRCQRLCRACYQDMIGIDFEEYNHNKSTIKSLWPEALFDRYTHICFCGNWPNPRGPCVKITEIKGYIDIKRIRYCHYCFFDNAGEGFFS